MPRAFSFSSPEMIYCLVLIVVMALTTRYLQRRDQRRAALCEVKTSADVTEDSHKGAEAVDPEKQAEPEISPM